MQRLGLSLILLVLASLIALGWLGDRLFGSNHSPEDRSVQVALEFSAILAAELENTNNGIFAQPLSTTTIDGNTGYSLQLLGVDELSLPGTLREQLKRDSSLTLETDHQVTVYHVLQGNTALLALSLPQSKPQRVSVRLGLTILFYAALALLLMLWLYPLISRIKKLTHVANAVGQGDFSQQVSTSPNSNLFSIEMEFNRMSQRIQSLLEDNRLLSGAVSHDLRTPLARLRFGIDALQEQEHNDVSSKYLQRINQDLNSMEQLVSVLLEFVKLDRQLDELPLGNVSLTELLMDCLSNVDAPAHINIRSDIADVHSVVEGEERFTRMLINNLLDNAIKHARTHVVISINEKRDVLWLSVDDDGPGFGDTDPDALVKPFVRGTDAPIDEQRKGYGLGLAIVNRIADWYGAELLLQSSDLYGGARVRVGFKAVIRT